MVLVWRLDRWGRSVANLLATLQERSTSFVNHQKLFKGDANSIRRDIQVPPPGRHEGR